MVERELLRLYLKHHPIPEPSHGVLAVDQGPCVY